MKYLIILLCACEGLTSSSQPNVSVLKRTDEGCFSLMTPDAPVASELGVTDVCPYLSEPQLIAAVDYVEVVVDYGADVAFAGDTHAPPPNIALTIDGGPGDAQIVLSGEQRIGSRAFFVATFHVPPTLSTDVRIAAGVNPGFHTDVPVTFSILPTPVDLSLVNCTQGTGCDLIGGVGRAQLKVVVPGDVAQVVQLHGTIDGQPQLDPLPPVTTQTLGNHTEALAQIPIPAAHEGAVWNIGGQIYATQTAEVTAVIHAPTILSALTCGASCAAGSSTGLVIGAPNGITPLSARIDTSLDGVPQIVGATAPLVENANGTATGQLALTAPGAGTWQIDVHVAGYAAPSIVTTVH